MTTAAKTVVAFMVLLSLALSACGGDNKSPTSPTPVPAPPHTSSSTDSAAGTDSNTDAPSGEHRKTVRGG